MSCGNCGDCRTERKRVIEEGITALKNEEAFSASIKERSRLLQQIVERKTREIMNQYNLSESHSRELAHLELGIMPPQDSPKPTQKDTITESVSLEEGFKTVDKLRREMKK